MAGVNFWPTPDPSRKREGGNLTPSSLLLVLLAAVCHATWNLASKRSAHAGGVFLFWTTLLSSFAFAPWALWIMAQEGFRWTWLLLAAICASGCLHLAYSHALQTGYRKADLSVVYPIARGTGPLLSSTGAFLLLGEVPGPLRLLGLLAVVGGILLIATNGLWSTFAKPGATVGLRWGMLTGAIIATYTLVDGASVKLLLISPVVLDWGANVVRTALLAPQVLRDRPIPLRVPVMLVAQGLGQRRRVPRRQELAVDLDVAAAAVGGARRGAAMTSRCCR